MQPHTRARHFTAAIAATLFLLLLATTAMSNEAITQSTKSETTTGELLLDLPGGGRSSALLLQSEITGSISGLVASITLTQQFQNTSSEWVNGRYQFPLPNNAAIDSLTLKTEGRIIRGVVKEKEQAKKEFEAAKASGKKAGLLKQNRPNLFALSLANIAPDSKIEAEITWVQTVTFDGGQFSLRFPTTLTPRFIPGQALPGKTDTMFNPEDFEAKKSLSIDVTNGWAGWAANTDQVPDASEITPFQVHEPELIGGHTFSIDLKLNPGIALSGITSATHSLQVSDNKFDPENTSQDKSQRIQFTNGFEKLDRDLVINWTPAASSQPEAAVFNQATDDAHYSLIMLMPPAQTIVQTLPKEMIFIIDSSGSMAGVSMTQAKQGLQTALSYLSPADRFNIVDFDSHAQTLFSNPASATAANVGKAIQFVDSLVADGGTNMEAALKLAFSQRAEEGFLKQIVFITDGSVGNESALFSLIHNRLGSARLFTVGIGSAPNQHFMRGAADYGRGSFSFIDSIDQAAVRMSGLFQKINRPVMRDIEIAWSEDEPVEFFPKRTPDLYVGEPLMVLAKSSAPLNTIEFSGRLAGNEWTRTINVDAAPHSDNLDKLWARSKIKHLESRQIMRGESMDAVRDEIVNLGVNHQLMTRYTSFVAIEEKPSKPADQLAKNEGVPNLMPKGNTMAVPVPNTATPATLLMLLGLVFTTLGMGFWRPRLFWSGFMRKVSGRVISTEVEGSPNRRGFVQEISPLRSR